jgi:hypothetical protein
VKRKIALAVGLLLIAGDTVAQQPSPPRHKYQFQAAFTAEGMKNLQKQSATGFRAGVVKFFESVGGRLASWYLDYANSTAYGFVDYPDEIAAAAAQASVNAGGFARVTYRPVLSAEDADKAFAKSVAVRPPQMAGAAGPKEPIHE